MPAKSLLIEVHLLDRRFHGRGDWPPAPFRLFQALIAGAYGGRYVCEARAAKDAAFKWLETLAPPLIAAPRAEPLKKGTLYVPNNDLDSVGGDPARIANIRTAKPFAPRFIVGHAPLLYVWGFDEGETHARCIAEMAHRLHTFGWGIDAAFARAEILDAQQAEDRLRTHGGAISRPSDTGRSKLLNCPAQGSLVSLQERFEKGGSRFKYRKAGPSSTRISFRKPPPARHSRVAYDSPPARLVFELAPADDTTPENKNRRFAPLALTRAAELVCFARDHAANRLGNTYPAATIERFLIGRGATEADKARRVRFIPLPSIGFTHADRAIRRLLVEVPADCPLNADDMAWALSGAHMGEETIDEETGEVRETGLRLRPSDSDKDKMLGHYGISENKEARVWRSVTPVILNLGKAGKRAKGKPVRGRERANFEKRFAAAVKQALRHAGFDEKEVHITRIQREPFEARGQRAEDFAARLPQYLKDRSLRHVEIVFLQPQSGPILLGDGRFMGLGLMAPVSNASVPNVPVPHDAIVKPTIARFTLAGPQRPSIEDTIVIAEVVRKTVMAKFGFADDRKGQPLAPPAISGKDRHGRPLATGSHEHGFFLPEDADQDGLIDHVILYVPSGLCASTCKRLEEVTKIYLPKGRHERRNKQWRLALEGFGDQDSFRDSPLLASARKWVSVTPYLMPWHPKKHFGVPEMIARECKIRNLPAPETVEMLPAGRTVNGDRALQFRRFRARQGLSQPDKQGAFVKLTFGEPVRGPLALGFACHFGLGLFRPAD